MSATIRGGEPPTLRQLNTYTGTPLLPGVVAVRQKVGLYEGDPMKRMLYFLIALVAFCSFSVVASPNASVMGSDYAWVIPPSTGAPPSSDQKTALSGFLYFHDSIGITNTQPGIGAVSKAPLGDGDDLLLRELVVALLAFDAGMTVALPSAPHLLFYQVARQVSGFSVYISVLNPRYSEGSARGDPPAYNLIL